MNTEVLVAKLRAMRAEIDAALTELGGPKSAPRGHAANDARMTPEDYAAYVKKSKRTILRWCRIGLPHGRVGNAILVRVREADEWMSKGGAVAAARRHASAQARKGGT